MSETTKLVPVPFHGDTIMAIETPAGRFVALKPICERLGLDFSAQFRRINREPERWGVAVMAIPSGRGVQETVSIPLNRVAAFLFTVTVSRVKPEIRDALALYQAEAADVLDRHFRLRDEQQDAVHALRDKMMWHLQQHLLLANPKWSKAHRLMELGSSDYLIARQIGCTLGEWGETKVQMQACGLAPKYRSDMAIKPEQLELPIEDWDKSPAEAMAHAGRKQSFDA